jgi:hypothetical protein
MIMHTLKPAFCSESKVFAEHNDVPPVLWLNTGGAKPEHVTISVAHGLESQPFRRVDRQPSSANTRHNASTIITSFTRSVAFRPRLQTRLPAPHAARFAPSQCRSYADSKTSGANDRSKKIDAQPADHISEEAAKTAQIMGEEGPDMSKGTPIEDVRDMSVRGHDSD